jgi:hypothetical protein
MTQEEAQYVLDVIIPRRSGMIKRDRLDEVLKYSNMLSGRNVSSPGCSCEFQAYWHQAYSVLDQYIDVINNAANPPQRKTRKK